MKKVKQYFIDNPEVEQVYQSSDGLYHYTHKTAKNHSKGLAKKRVTKITRDEVGLETSKTLKTNDE